nr:hypothetical protein [Planctomycetales bacterium]
AFEATQVVAQAEIEAQARVETQVAQATAAALEAHATRQALDLQATHHALDLQATATEAAARATQAAVNANGTLGASAANATGTAVALLATSTAESRNATATQEWANVTATSIRLTQEYEELALQRAKDRQVFTTFGSTAMIVLATVVLLVLLYHVGIPWLKLRAAAIKKDRRGDSPIFVFPLPHGSGQVVVDPDRMLWPGTVIEGSTVQQPATAPPDLQDRVTGRDQLVDLRSRGLPEQERRRLPRNLSVASPPTPQPQVQVVQSEVIPQWIADVRERLTEGEIEQ